MNTIQPQFFSASFFLASFFWATQHQFPLDDRKQTRVSISDTHEAALRSTREHDHTLIYADMMVFSAFISFETRGKRRDIKRPEIVPVKTQVSGENGLRNILERMDTRERPFRSLRLLFWMPSLRALHAQ